MLPAIIVQKLLANTPGIDNPINHSKKESTVPRKTKNTVKQTRDETAATVVSDANGAAEKPARRAPVKAKKSGTKKNTKRASSKKGSATLSSGQPTDEEIRIRAYFIAERRHRLALPGDADSDWLEAKRQLLSEIGPR